MVWFQNWSSVLISLIEGLRVRLAVIVSGLRRADDSCIKENDSSDESSSDRLFHFILKWVPVCRQCLFLACCNLIRLLKKESLTLPSLVCWGEDPSCWFDVHQLHSSTFPMRANDVKLVSFRRGMLGEIASGGERKGPFFFKREKRWENWFLRCVGVSLYK